MISSVIISGLCKENLDNGFREFLICDNENEIDTTKFTIVKVLYWSRQIRNLITNLPLNTHLIIKGRLEVDEDVGVYVLAETIHFTNCKNTI